MNFADTKKPERLHGLDHLRALAIVLVLFFHFGVDIPEPLNPIRRIGWTGVDLFFVLSGYLIGNQLLKEIIETNQLRFKAFYIKRFFRIIPIYLVVLAIYFLLPNIIEGNGLPPLWRFLTFTQNLGLDVTTQNSFSHAWSLCIEEQFYIFIPVLLFYLYNYKPQKLLPILLIGLIISGLVFRLYNWNTYVNPLLGEEINEMAQTLVERIYYPTLGRIDGLVYGVAISALFNFKPKFMERLTKYGNLILLFGLVVLYIAFKICSHLFTYNNAIFGFSLAPLGYALCVLAALSPTCLLYRIKSKVTFFIASVSYSVYLIHKLVFHWVKSYYKDSSFHNSEVVIFVISIAMSILVGYMLYLVIEKPFMRLRRQILSE